MQTPPGGEQAALACSGKLSAGPVLTRNYAIPLCALGARKSHLAQKCMELLRMSTCGVD